MVALDTNVLVYAETPLVPQHARAAELLRELAEGSVPWALPWPCVYEFLRVVTHPRAWKRSMPLDRARADLRIILASPSLVLLSETERHLRVLDELLATSGVTGNLIFDAHIAALCIEHGVSELLTADADFRRFAGVKVRDPFTA